MKESAGRIGLPSAVYLRIKTPLSPGALENSKENILDGNVRRTFSSHQWLPLLLASRGHLPMGFVKLWWRDLCIHCRWGGKQVRLNSLQSWSRDWQGKIRSLCHPLQKSVTWKPLPGFPLNHLLPRRGMSVLNCRNCNWKSWSDAGSKTRSGISNKNRWDKLNYFLSSVVQ